MTFETPAPMPDADSTAFWEAANEGELLGQRCADCSVWRWPPREYCPACHASAPLWEPVQPSGTIAGLSIVERAISPAFADFVPYAIAHVRVDGTDGRMVLPALATNVVSDDLAVGMRVTLTFETGWSPTAVPMFTISDQETTNDSN